MGSRATRTTIVEAILLMEVLAAPLVAVPVVVAAAFTVVAVAFTVVAATASGAAPCKYQRNSSKNHISLVF